MISEEMLFLDRHHVWQSHDQAFHFCEDVTPPFMFCIFFVQTHPILSKLQQTWVNLAQTQLNSAQFCSAQLDLVQLGSTRPNATRPNTTRLNSTRLNSTRLNSTRLTQLGLTLGLPTLPKFVQSSNFDKF